MTTASVASSTSGACSRSGAGTSRAIATRIAPVVVPPNGRVPLSIS